MHFQQKGGVVFLVFDGFSTGVSDDTEILIGIDLSEDGSHTSRGVFVSAGCIGD